LQSRPYLSLEGVHGDFSVDGIALGIGCLLHDMEAMQFSDERHPPQHVAHSQVSYSVVGTIIHPALDDFLQVVKENNNRVSDNIMIGTLKFQGSLSRLLPMSVKGCW
jgi:hypothetical protein